MEVPNYQLSNDTLKEICKLTRLTRLQLPLVVDNLMGKASEFPRPEAIPMLDQSDERLIDFSWEFLQLINDRTNAILVQRSGGAYGGGYIGYDMAPGSAYASQVLSETGIEHLANLKQLEYLFMPGFLLSERTMDIITSLPKLRELHAPFSLVTPSLLRRISALDLESLSVGVLGLDDDKLRSLSSMRQLHALQLFVFASHDADTVKTTKRAEDTLRKALPSCEIHVRYATGEWTRADEVAFKLDSTGR